MAKRNVVEIGPEIDLPISVCKDGVLARVFVTAELVPEIAPHLASVASFAVHLVVDYPPIPDGWRVSNIETGLRVSGHTGHTTKTAAIEMARRRLADVTIEMLDKAMASSPAGNGA